MVAIVKTSVPNKTPSIQKDLFKDRLATDKLWFYVAFFIGIIWLGAIQCLNLIKNKLEPLGNNACIFDTNNTELEDLITRSIFNLARIDERSHEYGSIVLYANIFLYVFTLIFALFAIFFRVYHKYFAHCAIVFLGIQLVSITYRTSMYYMYDSSRSIIPWDDDFIDWMLPDFVAFFVCLILIFVVILRHGISTASQTVRKTIRFYTSHSPLLLFGLLILTIMAFLIYFTLVMIKGVGTRKIALSLPMTILLGSTYFLLVLYYLGVAVISLATANNYWMQNGMDVRFADVSRSAVVILRYHIGTICFNATLILPLVALLLALLKSVYRTIRSRSGFQRKYIMVAFFFFVGEYCTMITAISGRNAFDAIDRFVHLPIDVRRVARNLRQNQMIWMILGLIMISVNNLMLIVNWTLGLDDPYFTQASIFSYATIIYLFMPVALMVDVIMDTIILCDVDKNEAINITPREECNETTVNVRVTLEG